MNDRSEGLAESAAIAGADDIGVREAAGNDSAAVIDLIARCFADYPGCVMDLPGLDADLPRVAANFREAGGCFWVAERAGRIVGCVGYAPAGAGLELKRLYVDRAARRQGLASRLLARVLEVAMQRRAASIRLWSDTRFAEAHAFYLRHGFVPTGETRKLHDPSDTTEYEFRRDLAAR